MKNNILLYGEGGTGKTSSIISILKLLKKNPELKIRFLSAESNSILGIRDGLERFKIKLEPRQLLYMDATPSLETAPTSQQLYEEYYEGFHSVTTKDALSVKTSAMEKTRRKTFIKILKDFAYFKGVDLLTEEVVDCKDYLKWGPNYVFVIDSLTAICDYLLEEVKGSRILTVMSDYGHVQSNLMSKVINPLCEVSKCHIIVLGHPFESVDPAQKQPKDTELRITKIFPMTCGSALNSRLISKFTDVIFAYKRGSRYFWTGNTDGISTSTRNFPSKSDLVPDFSLYKFFE